MLRRADPADAVAPAIVRVSMMSAAAAFGAEMLPSIDWSTFLEQLRRLVAARVHSESDVDDLVQLILERAVTKAGSAEIENATGWLFGIARNAIADDMEGRSMKSIADELGIGLSAIKSRVQRARIDFVQATSDCCANTVDARGRVTDLTARALVDATECQYEPTTPIKNIRSRS